MSINGELGLILESQVEGKSLEACYMEGYWMSEQEMDDSSNPFDEDSQAYEYWEQGYFDCLSGQAPLFPEAAFSPIKDQTRDELETSRTSKRRFNLQSKMDYALYGLGTLVAGAAVYSLAFIDLVDLAA